MQPRVNKWLDFLDRVGWTGLQVGLGVAVASIAAGMDWKQVLITVGVAVLGAAAKVATGQNTGTDDTGSLIGQPVIEPPPVGENK